MMPEGRVAPRASEAEASRIASEIYGMTAGASALPGEYDDNFRLQTNEGDAFVLKLMHPARKPGLVELQVAALGHLAERASRLCLPRVLRTREGATLASARDAEGNRRLVFMLTWLPGRPLAEARPRSPELLAALGGLLGSMDEALADFAHPAAHRSDLKWDLARAGWIRGHLDAIGDGERRALVEGALARYEAEVVPALPGLRRGVVYGDANDWNVIVGPPAGEARSVGVVDFGDMHHGVLASEPAIAAAYALLGQRDALGAAFHLVRGYHAALPLREDEIALLHPLIAMRLAVSVTNSAIRRALLPDDPYVTISEAPAWEALARLSRIPPRLAHYRFREACGLPPVPHAARAAVWLREEGGRAAPVLEADLRGGALVVLDLSVGSLLLGADPGAADADVLGRTVRAEAERAGVPVALGRYDEARAFYASDVFGPAGSADERRTVHLGIDLFVPPGSPVRAALDGLVHVLANNAAPLDYGPLVILRHDTGDGPPVFTLYGHLTEDTLAGLSVGQRLARGQLLGRVGSPPTNGGWAPHLHFQVILDLLDLGADFPGVAYASQRALWKSLSPDPNLLLGIPDRCFPAPAPSPGQALAMRRERLSGNLRLSYRKPLEVVRGFGAWLYDETGRAFLDLYNNVPLVGHSHPRVVRAVRDQLALLNTNTRYLHETILRYADRLTRLLPEPLRVCFFVNSGSEANELALRLARAHTGREDVIVLEHAYHGHTTTLIDVSPCKFAGPGGHGRRPWVHVAPLPDDYRGPYRRDDAAAGRRYAQHVGEIAEGVRAAGSGIAAFLAETLPSVAGQIVFPDGYLAEAYRLVRGAGGVCIADEVQTGFGRLGAHFWGFEAQQVVPDVVVLGKPIGNAFPLGAVVTTREIAASFDNGMEFFSTFGGNPVACAAGLAVLDVVEEERLQERARRVGARLITGLRELMDRHPLIGDVRGSGLFLGVELVRDRATLEPAPAEADYVVNRLRERGILTGTDGPHHNVLKLRPPLVLSDAEADLFLATLDAVLDEDAAQPPVPQGSRGAM